MNAKRRRYVPGTVKGLSRMVAHNGQVVYSQALGNQTVGSILPIASASKMPSALAIMTLVDEGKLNLDEPVGDYLRGKIDWPPDKATITMRMLLNHISGLQRNPPCLRNVFSTLRDCAGQIANEPQEFSPPGCRFAYGGGGF